MGVVSGERRRARRSILCFPLQDERGSVVGVAELCNKLGSPHFSAQDEEIARAFSIYCCISLVQVLYSYSTAVLYCTARRAPAH